MFPLLPVARRCRAANVGLTILEAKVLAPRALHVKLREMDAEKSFGDMASEAEVGEERDAVASVGRMREPGGVLLELHLRVRVGGERDTDPPSFLGIVEGSPEIPMHARTMERGREQDPDDPPSAPTKSLS